jgi:hypothetical protein
MAVRPRHSSPHAPSEAQPTAPCIDARVLCAARSYFFLFRGLIAYYGYRSFKGA